MEFEITNEKRMRWLIKIYKVHILYPSFEKKTDDIVILYFRQAFFSN